MPDLEDLLRHAEAVVAEAAAKLVVMQAAPLDAQRKDLRDIVTAADLASEQIVVSGLARLTPDAGIIAEESGVRAGSNGARWIIDPLDGTVNYARGLPWFSVTVAYEERGDVALGLIDAPAMGLKARFLKGAVASVDGRPVMRSDTDRVADSVISVILTSHFSDDEVRRAAAIVERLGRAARGVRIVISGGLEMALVASGRLDGFVSIKADAVSHAAALPLVRAAGGKVTRVNGDDSGVDDLEKIASNGLIHDELLQLVGEALQ
jgi:fructose-1,6-bisphosphatase/inositol monophosphatase family enzyme